MPTAKSPGEIASVRVSEQKGDFCYRKCALLDIARREALSCTVQDILKGGISGGQFQLQVARAHMQFIRDSLLAHRAGSQIGNDHRSHPVDNILAVHLPQVIHHNLVIVLGHIRTRARQGSVHDASVHRQSNLIAIKSHGTLEVVEVGLGACLGYGARQLDPQRVDILLVDEADKSQHDDDPSVLGFVTDLGTDVGGSQDGFSPGIIIMKFRVLGDDFVIFADPFVKIAQACTGQQGKSQRVHITRLHALSYGDSEVGIPCGLDAGPEQTADFFSGEPLERI